MVHSNLTYELISFMIIQIRGLVNYTQKINSTFTFIGRCTVWRKYSIRFYSILKTDQINLFFFFFSDGDPKKIQQKQASLFLIRFDLLSISKWFWHAMLDKNRPSVLSTALYYMNKRWQIHVINRFFFKYRFTILFYWFSIVLNNGFEWVMNKNIVFYMCIQNFFNKKSKLVLSWWVGKEWD